MTGSIGCRYIAGRPKWHGTTSRTERGIIWKRISRATLQCRFAGYCIWCKNLSDVEIADA